MFVYAWPNTGLTEHYHCAIAIAEHITQFRWLQNCGASYHRYIEIACNYTPWNLHTVFPLLQYSTGRFYLNPLGLLYRRRDNRTSVREVIVRNVAKYIPCILYSDITMRSMASHIMTVCSVVCSGAHEENTKAKRKIMYMLFSTLL